MDYSVIIGIAASFSFDWEGWVFFSVVLLFIFSGVSAYLSLNKSTFIQNDKKNKKKILTLIGIFLMFFLLFGLVGLIAFTLIHFITISFIADYGLGEK